jgi:hypothetical protein
MAIDMDAMLATIKDRQWALAGIDWDAPGAELITDEQRPKLKAFMADLCWIENIGARGFSALAKKAPTPTIAEIYRYFHAEEQRHANAELAMMKRRGMLSDGEVPEPNVNIRLAIDWLDRWADDMPLSLLGTMIPMLEVALDGALLKFLLDEVDDQVCHQVFERGMEPERLYKAVKRFKELGDQGESTMRVPTYRFLRRYAGVVTNPRHPHHLLANSVVLAVRSVPASAAAVGTELGERSHPRAGGLTCPHTPTTRSLSAPASRASARQSSSHRPASTTS